MANAVYDVTFSHCRITGNTGAGNGSDYGVNGVKVAVGWGSTGHDITFVGCTFGAVSRMGIEIVTENARQVARIAIENCTFEPCGGECISFGSAGAAYSLVAGCTLKGYGNLANPQWAAGFEANTTTHIEMRNTRIWAGKNPPST